MTAKFTLEYWRDDDWYVGQLRQVPGIFSQGKTLKELEENIRDAYGVMRAQAPRQAARCLQESTDRAKRPCSSP